MRDRDELLSRRRIYEATHEKVAVMDFENQRGLLADRACIVCQCRLVGGTDFAKFGPACFQDFANSKTATDLNEFAARNDDFVWRDTRRRVRLLDADSAAPSNEMANDQNQGGRTIVHHRCRLGAAKHRDRALEVAAACTAFTAFQIELYIIISGSHVAQNFASALRQ